MKYCNPTTRMKYVAPEVTEVLNQIEAWHDLCKVNGKSRVLSMLAANLKKPYMRAYELVIVRRNAPVTTTFFAMKAWVDSVVSMLSPKHRLKFEKAVKEVKNRRTR